MVDCESKERPDPGEGFEYLCDRCPHATECEWVFEAYNVVMIGQEDWCLADR